MPGPPVTVIQAVDPAGALARYLGDLSDAVAVGRVPAGRDGTVSVDVLGRYGFERDVLPGTRRPTCTSRSVPCTVPRASKPTTS